jgi:hypothetical protein
MGQNAKYSERANNFRFALHERTSPSTNATCENRQCRKSIALAMSTAAAQTVLVQCSALTPKADSAALLVQGLWLRILTKKLG